MDKNLTKSVSRSFESKALGILLVLFGVVIAGGWLYAMKLRQTVVANNAVINVDARALIEVEQLRNMAESQISNARSFFLLGSKSLFDKQKKDKQGLLDSLANFEKQYGLPKIPDIIKHIVAIEEQQEEVFDQAMEFREKQTESKIVGQFYQSKTIPIRTALNEALDEIVLLHKAELERVRTTAREAALGVEVQIPRGMTWFTSLLAVLFLAMALIVVRMLKMRSRQMTERDRLIAEAKSAVLARDEVLSAISEDLKEPLAEIVAATEVMAKSTDAGLIGDGADFIKSSVVTVESLIKDICDQKKADMGIVTLRFDQIGIDEILDDARLMLQPIAKKRDIRLQFDSVNPPVLAFFDRERVLRVLSNLVGNAIKFSPKHTKVVVKVRSDQQFVNISVTDSGPGISESQLPQIFDHFWQAKKTADQGAGIGLGVVKTIIEAHGGSVRASSHAGAGTTFTFSLPRRRPVGAHLKRPSSMVRQTLRPHSNSQFSDGPNH